MERDLPLGPALDFLRGLWRLNHALERVSSRMEKDLGITARQRLVIRCVGKFPGLTAGQLAAQLHVDPGTVSAGLARLERRGLVERRRDERDRRRVVLGLTADGRSLDRDERRTVESAVEQLLERSDRAELAAAQHVFCALTKSLEGEAQRAVERGAAKLRAGSRPRASRRA